MNLTNAFWKLEGRLVPTSRVFPAEIVVGKRVRLSPGLDFSFRNLFNAYQIPKCGVLHVGAHEGQELQDYLDCGMGPILALEPSPEAFVKLKAMFGDNQSVELMEVAAGATPSMTHMFVATNGGQSNSLLKPHRHLREAPRVQFTGITAVEVKPLDEVLVEDHPYNFWIIDTQGYELQVLRGAGSRLESANFVLIEVNRAEVYENCARIREIDSHLSIFGLHRVMTRWWGSWGDALYVKATLCAR